MFIRDDIPTFDLPTNANSGNLLLGHWLISSPPPPPALAAPPPSPAAAAVKEAERRASDLEKEMADAEAEIFGGADTPLNLGEGGAVLPPADTPAEEPKPKISSQEALAKARIPWCDCALQFRVLTS